MKIAVINTGWSEDYRGSLATGDFSYLTDGGGHERFNFLPHRSKFYGYVPPLGGSAPKPAKRDNWLIFAVAKMTKRERGMRVVGWFEKASFLGEFKDRPDAARLGLDYWGGHYSHTFTAETAVSIPADQRDFLIPGGHVCRPFAYLRDGSRSDAWREEMAADLLDYRARYLKRVKSPETLNDEPVFGGICGDPARRREVEKAAIAQVIAHFDRTHSHDDRQALKCGYDLAFMPRNGRGSELHIEVKGTAMPEAQFFLSFNERVCADGYASRKKLLDKAPQWRLAVVTDALSRSPALELFDHAQMMDAFHLREVCWQGRRKRETE